MRSRPVINHHLHLFAGPSLGLTTQTRLSAEGIVLHQPIGRGDIQALIKDEPDALIAIADGLFHQRPAVGHAEIRDAIRSGARIWGLCSIGAIRAVELGHVGMCGFGDVFQAFHANPALPDDEVTLLHLPNYPYTAISEPLIHWRHYLQCQEESGVLSAPAKEHILSHMSCRWYGERTVEYGSCLLAKFGNILINPRDLDLALNPHRIKYLDLQKFIELRPWEIKNPVSYTSKSLSCSKIKLTELGGLPFIDDDFDASRFLSIVAGTRAGWLEPSRGRDDYLRLLSPEHVCEVASSKVFRQDLIPDCSALTEKESAWVNTALREVKVRSKSLAPLFELPIRLLRWQCQKISMTNPKIPQTIFLGEGALQSSFGILEEVLVHEFAHVWMGMMCELLDLQHRDAKQIHTLPSGTGSKDARGVLLALHFSCAVHRYLLESATTVPLIGRRAERLHYVLWYMRQATKIPIGADLSPLGQAVFDRMSHYAASYV